MREQPNPLQPRKAVLLMKEYHPPLADRIGLRLDFNENTSGCSPRVLAKLQQIAGDQLARYPEREPAEKQVAERFGVGAHQLLLTNGVDEAIHLICETYLEPEDEVVIPVPTFGMYEVYASQTGARVVTVQSDESLAIPVDNILRVITANTKLICIASPNNPTGAVLKQSDLVEMLNKVPHAALLLDEAYYDFYGETQLALLAQFPNLFIARTFSKAYGLAGFRVGVLIGSYEPMQHIRRVSSPYNVNGVALACLETAIKDETYIREYVAQVLAGRELLEQTLTDCGLRWWPSQANFILFYVGDKHTEFVHAMRQRGILVRDRHNDPGCAGCVRITLGTREHTARMLTELYSTVKELGIGR
jgi:histidinol-phosphate aminotransferase